MPPPISALNSQLNYWRAGRDSNPWPPRGDPRWSRVEWQSSERATSVLALMCLMGVKPGVALKQNAKSK